MTPPTLGQRIAEARHAAGLTQRQLGDAIRADQMTVSRYERGAMEPGAATLRKLAQALGVTSDHLLGLPVRGE